MISLIRNILFLSSLLAHLIFSQSIKKIEIEGNRIFSDNEIKNWANLYEGQSFNSSFFDSSKTKIAAELNSAGYFHSTFDKTEFQFSSDSQTVNVLLHVEEGKPTYVNKLLFSSDDTINAEEHLSSFNYLKGEVFNIDTRGQGLHTALANDTVNIKGIERSSRRSRLQKRPIFLSAYPISTPQNLRELFQG